jgi:CRP/FNR family transcriptional regulator
MLHADTRHFSAPIGPAFRPGCFPEPAAAPDSLDDCFAQSRLCRIEAKEFVFMEGDVVNQIHRIEVGAVSLYRLLPDGRRQILGFAYPGDIIGLGIQREYIMNAQALKPTKLRSMSLAALHRIAAQDPELSFTLYQTVANELTATRDLLMTTGHRSACERVAAFLLTLSQRNGRKGEAAHVIDLPMTRLDIADFLGLTVETVSRTITKMKTRGLIDLPQCARIHLRDIGALRALAEGDDGE